jgi:cation diffusion facilitator CzcD-associated flavoprotein CzcO
MAFDAGGSSTALSVLIIGTGFSGLGMGIRLKQEGFNSFTILERGDDVGGTWRDNHYPGCACDVPSHLYSFSFEPNPNWSRMFAPQAEIKAYLQHCARKYELLPHVRFGCEVTEARFDELTALWHVTTRDGRHFSARVLVSGMGGLSNPAYPSLPGLDSFQGAKFHSAHWNHDYDLRGKRVAVIGTGASAIQFVPHAAAKAAQLDLYQRTPPWILPKPDRDISRFERWLFRVLPITQRFWRGAIYTIAETRVLGIVINPKIMTLAQKLAERHIHRQIRDPQLRRKLTPNYTMGCKRVLMSNDYYPALAQSNVDVITNGIREVKAHSIVTSDGRERPVDAIIFGTGFKAQELIDRGMLFDRKGGDIMDGIWRQGYEAYLGTTVSSLPNFFMLMGPNTGLGHSSMVYMIESQIQYTMAALQAMREKSLRTLDIRQDVQANFNAGIQKQLGRAVWSSGCKSWYLDNSGKNTTLWPGFTFRFRQLTGKFRTSDYLVESESRSVKA